MTALEHLTIVDRELIATFYRTVRALPPWPADVPRPTDDDLDAMERLADYGNCGQCASPALHLHEITVEEAKAANAANPGRLFPVRPRKAHTFPANNACYCDHQDQTGYTWRAYGAMIDRWPAQATLRAAYGAVDDLIPALRDLIAARWIDREAVLAMLGGKTAVEDCNGKPVTGESDFWCDPAPRADGSLHFGDGTEEGRVPGADQRLQRLLLALFNESTGIKYHDLATAWASHDQSPPLRDQTLAKYARDLRNTFPTGMRRRLVVSKWGCVLQKDASVSVRASAQVSAGPE